MLGDKHPKFSGSLKEITRGVIERGYILGGLDVLKREARRAQRKAASLEDSPEEEEDSEEEWRQANPTKPVSMVDSMFGAFAEDLSAPTTTDIDFLIDKLHPSQIKKDDSRIYDQGSGQSEMTELLNQVLAMKSAQQDYFRKRNLSGDSFGSDEPESEKVLKLENLYRETFNKTCVMHNRHPELLKIDSNTVHEFKM